jgi:4-amino-4-deoxy-L-arabinose transferase-like glycosyltransferase
MKNYLKKIKVFSPRLSPKLILGLILLLAAFLRLYGLNWDQGQHLHPDERFLTMVGVAIKLPQTFKEYLDPRLSPMNPYNAQYPFFVYGTFPLNLTKAVSVFTSNNNYNQLCLVGRLLAAFFDIGVVFLIFKIGQKIFNPKTGLLAALCYSLMVLPIQLSHFFAVDTFLNFFLVLAFYLLTLFIFRPQFSIASLLGITFGFALACKISALYFLPVVGLVFLFLFFKNPRSITKLLATGIIFLLLSLLTFRLNQPPVFNSGSFLDWRLNHQFVENLNELKSLGRSNSWFPPSIQWKKTVPLLFPLKNLVLWGLGLPLSLLALTASSLTVAEFLKASPPRHFLQPANWTSASFLRLLAVFWISGLFIYQGTQFVKTMRYLLPIYPFLALLTADLINRTISFLNAKLPKRKIYLLVSLLFLLLFIYPLSFLSIYSEPTTRLAASEWLYQNVPAGSTLANEHWDDALPLPLPSKTPAVFKSETLELYHFDTPQKWQKIARQLEKTDFLILSSNRLYAPLMKVSEKYPQTTQYYQDLFSGSLGFVKVAEFTSRPCFPPLKTHWFCFNDDEAEEAFTVYDHPKVIIFKKSKGSN